MSITGANQPLLLVKDLRVEIPTRKETLVAVDQVSFHIDPGEVLRLVKGSWNTIPISRPRMRRIS